MATAITGLKRSYHQMQMHDTGLSSGHFESSSGPPSQSPSGISSRGSSQPGHDRGSDRTEFSKSLPRNASFQPSVSIVLIGVRGVGKTTLGILAATAYGRRLIDTERAFQEATGITASDFRKAKGTAEHRKQHVQVLESTLKNNSSGAVIVCNFSDLEGNGAGVLRDYARSHPVIHITRDAEGVRSLLKIWTIERVDELLAASAPLLRSCSNYEFYNLTESNYGHERTTSNDQNRNGVTHEHFLTLKRVERDFLKLLRNIVGGFERSQSHHSAYPLSQVEVERRSFTSAVTIATTQVLEGNIDFDNAQIGTDCIELLVDQEFISKRGYLSSIAKAFAIARRSTILPIMLSVESARLSMTDNSMIKLYDFCLRLGAELCVVDLSLTDSQLLSIVKSRGNSRIIGQARMPANEQNSWNQQKCVESYSRAVRIGCDIVKITMPAVSVEHVFDVQALQRQVEQLELRVPLIAYGTGPNGRTSKCFNKTLTSVRPQYAPTTELTDSEEVANLSAQDISKALFGAFVFDPLRFYIYGADVSYSLSPAMHNVAYKACGMRYAYEAMSSDSIETLKRLTTMHDFGGSAVTQPYKTSALEFMDGLSPHAKAIGAVNTIIPIRQLSSDGGIPDELDIISRRTQQGPVKALFGFNTGMA